MLKNLQNLLEAIGISTLSSAIKPFLLGRIFPHNWKNREKGPFIGIHQSEFGGHFCKFSHGGEHTQEIFLTLEEGG